MRQRRDLAVLAAAEQEELELRAGVDDVAELLRALDLPAQDAPRVADERLAARREDVADDPGGAARPDAVCHGISANVVMSGIRYWSLSAIRVKPSIELPSNQVPWRTEPSSWWIGIVTALTRPMMSVNWSWTNRMPRSLAPLDLLGAVDRLGAITTDPPPAPSRATVKPSRLVPTCTMSSRHLGVGAES